MNDSDKLRVIRQILYDSFESQKNSKEYLAGVLDSIYAVVELPLDEEEVQ